MAATERPLSALQCLDATCVGFHIYSRAFAHRLDNSTGHATGAADYALPGARSNAHG